MTKRDESEVTRVVVVGGGYGGVLAALRMQRALRGRAEVVLVDPRPHMVERVRLHEHVARGRTVEHPYAGLLRRSGVRFVRGWASDFDLVAGSLRVGASTLHFDRLLLAVGSGVARPSVPGVREHASSLDPEQSESLRSRVLELAARGGRVLVVGGGLTGIEMAAELAEAHRSIAVTLATRGELGEMVSEAGRMHLRGVLGRLGVALHEHVEIARLEAGRAWLADERSLAFDLCIWAGGFAASPLLRELGLRVDARGSALVDPCLRALGHERVFVGGDAASLPLPEQMDTTIPMGCKTALPLAAHAADNLVASVLGRALEPFDYADTLLCISLGRHDALVQAMPGAQPGRVLARGRVAAWVKERICRYTILALHLQRLGIAMRWAKTGRRTREALAAAS